MSMDHLRYVEHQSGDGYNDSRYEVDVTDDAVFQGITYAQSEANYDHTGGAAEQLLVLATTANLSHASSELQVGDILRIETAVLNYTARVLTIVDNKSVTVEGLPAVDIAANAILSLTLSRTGQTTSPRFRAASTSGIKLKLKVFSDFFSNKKWVPLFLMKNLQLTFELERGALAFQALCAPGTSPSITYTITNPRLIATMVTPAQSELEGMLSAYNSSDGIYFPFISYQHHLKSVTAGTSGSLTIPANCRSARAFIFAQYPAFSEAVATASYVNDTIGITIKNLMTQFQIKVGSENYPYCRPVDTDDVCNGDSMAQLQQALGHWGNNQFSNSIINSEYAAINTINAVANESKRWVGGVLLARDDSSTGTGVDLINNDVILEYQRSAAGIDCYFRTFLLHDRAVVLSRAGIVVFS